MRGAILTALLASLALAGCALDPYSTQPEVDIDPEKAKNPTYPDKAPEKEETE